MNEPSPTPETVLMDESKCKEMLRKLTAAPKLPEEYEKELQSCDDWIKWCEENGGDWYGINFHQGRRSGIVFGNIIESKAKDELRSAIAAKDEELARMTKERDLWKRTSEAKDVALAEWTKWDAKESAKLDASRQSEARLRDALEIEKDKAVVLESQIKNCEVNIEQAKRTARSQWRIKVESAEAHIAELETSEARLREENANLKTALLKVHDLATWSSDNPVTDALANRIVEVTLPFFTPTNTDANG